MLLQELFDTSVPYHVVTQSPEKFITKATIGKRDITFGAYQAVQRKELDRWYLEFEEHGENKGHHLTGSGNEFEVLSMVKNSIIDFVKQYSPKAMIFTADHKFGGSPNGRGNVYERLLKSCKLIGYEIKRLADNTSHTDRFSIRKIVEEEVKDMEISTQFHFSNGMRAEIKISEIYSPARRIRSIIYCGGRKFTTTYNPWNLMSDEIFKRIERIMAHKLESMAIGSGNFNDEYRRLFKEIMQDFDE